MMRRVHDLLLEPGDLAVLLSAFGLEVSSASPLAASPLLAHSVPARTVTEIADGIDMEALRAALDALAAPSLVFAGRRGARRLPPWPFVVCRRNGGPAVVIATEGDGCIRLRFPYAEDDLVAWLAGPFRRFAAPEIACAEIPALAPSGMAVLLALVDIFRDRYPELDPDWQATAPITFTSDEVTAKLAAIASGSERSSTMSALGHLGGPTTETLSHETVESLLGVFANEGYLEMDVPASTPLFTMSDAFLGIPVSLAWWDLSFSLESRLDGGLEPIRIVQGLALWRFITDRDNRTTMMAVSGEELEMEIAALLSAPATATPGA